MSDQQNDSISMNLKLLTIIIASIISVFGFFITRTLNSIDNNIINLSNRLDKKSDIVDGHETRLQLLEERVKESILNYKKDK